MGATLRVCLPHISSQVRTVLNVFEFYVLGITHYVFAVCFIFSPLIFVPTQFSQIIYYVFKIRLCFACGYIHFYSCVVFYLMKTNILFFFILIFSWNITDLDCFHFFAIANYAIMEIIVHMS